MPITNSFVTLADRKKDLVKLQAGEYVSLGKVESELKTCAIVDNICVYGDSSKQYCVALVVPNQTQLESLAEKRNIPNSSFEQLCNNGEMEKIVLQELSDHGKKCEFQLETKMRVINASNFVYFQVN